MGDLDIPLPRQITISIDGQRVGGTEVAAPRRIRFDHQAAALHRKAVGLLAGHLHVGRGTIFVGIDRPSTDACGQDQSRGEL